MAVDKGPKQAPTYSGPTTTPSTAASRNKGSRGPTSSPMPQMRPRNFDAIVAQQLQAASDGDGPTPRVLGGPNQNVSNFSQSMGNLGRGIADIYQTIQPFTPLGMAMGLVQNIGKGINAARNGGGPDPKVAAARQQQLMAQQSSMGDDESSIVPPVPSTQQDTNQYPQERPAWWPSYLPWPPPSQAGAQYSPAPMMPQVPQMGTQPTGSLPAPTPYGTSYSSLQSAISGAQNPLTMGIGGMLRRP